ncbi:PREDICTED: nck-associated protein 5-like, partial [Ficedula albicollis]|uniref:nck-associated protein 5-like n=1 Tax=Ficedula albicollis TaxID=59894 RepID=UPI0007AD7DAA
MSESVAEAPAAGSPAALGETGTSHELLQRLRELEAENSALAQANENQRETYERCLDEVANHVVQALLNQKDLREECIKLKKRVFELERQNQVLSDLFQQKLQLSTGSLPQLPLHPVPVPPDVPVTPQPGSAEQQPPPLLPGLCLSLPEVLPPVPSGSPGLSPGAPPLDALSPFFKKKAQILEVLRKLEETDPLLGPPPASPGSPEPCAPLACPRAPGAEAKGKAAGLASWFGLRRSKLPALSRRGDGGRGREWAGTPAPLRREVKLAARKLEAESLNISKLMEKAEDLRKALREEHAFLQGLALEKGRPRGPPRGPGPLPVMYQEVTAETFMQQLLDRVDGKDVPYETRLEHKRELCDLRRVPPDAKEPRLCRPPRNGIVGHLREPSDKVPDVGLRDELPSDESLSESGTAQHFAACGSLTRTLDSGIGTFPPPDYGGAPAKST